MVLGVTLGGAHDQAGFGGVVPQRFAELVLGLSRPGLPDKALFGRVRAQQVGPAFHGDVIFLAQLVDPLQADVAPGSNIVVPHRDINRFIVSLGGLYFFRHLGPPAGRVRLILLTGYHQ